MLKYKIYVLFLFILTLGSINYINANNNSLPLFGKVIYIDPGHGGYWKIQKLWNDYKC